MNQRKATVGKILAAVGVLIFTLGMLLLKPENEPQYKGHSLSDWVNAVGAQSDNDTGVVTPNAQFEAATNAICQIGTNAVPFLLKWIRYDSPAWVRPIYQLPGTLGDKLRKFVGRDASRKTFYAVDCFRVLGTNANLAVPELTAMMRDTNAPTRAVRAILALASMGRTTFPLLSQALSDTNQVARETIIFGIASEMKDVGTNACVQLCVPALTDHDPRVRRAATNVLMFFAPKAISNGIPTAATPPAPVRVPPEHPDTRSPG